MNTLQNTHNILFDKEINDFGSISIRLMDLDLDLPLLYDWFQKDYAKYWGLQGKTLEETKAEYLKITAPTHTDAFVGFLDGHMAFLLERYDPAQDLIGKYYKVQPQDCGIHLMVAPVRQPKHNFTWHVFSAVMEFVFSDSSVRRVIVEPDIRNEKMFVLCKRIGFTNGPVVVLPHKTARLGFCTKSQFSEKQIASFTHHHMTKNIQNHTALPELAVSHVQQEVWAKANRHLIQKAICEFSHEQLIAPKLQARVAGWGHYELFADQEHIKYQFRAKALALQHLYIDTASIQKFKAGRNEPLDAILFIKEFKASLGISVEIMPSYIEEIISTLNGCAYKYLKGNPTAEELVQADFQTIEQSMTEGHPGFVANNGRIGFDANDYKAYAPEVGSYFPILWLAGDRDRTVYAGTHALPYEVLIQQELDTETIDTFNQVIIGKGFDPSSYIFIPVHPWQWFNKLAGIFAPELAQGKLICLGYGPDQYLAQQSIRTLFNATHPHKFYTKTSLSILNMGFSRGLPVYYLGSAPEMAEWLDALLMSDPYIQETGFAMLGEVASVSYINPYFEEFGKHHPSNKMIASLWRESPVAKIKPGQQLMTMAAFLHIDQHGTALLPAIIKKSGLSTEAWLGHYLKAYLSPLLHCFYQYDLVFMPHGENIIIALEHSVPVNAFLKDITEEAVILNPEIKLPKNIDRMYAQVPDELKLLSIFIDVFDGFFRFMSHILVQHAGEEEELFWACVANCVQEYQERYPEYEQKFQKYDLFAADFQLSCLNRLQLNNNKTMIDLDDPVALLQFKGKLQNPIASFKKALLTVE